MTCCDDAFCSRHDPRKAQENHQRGRYPVRALSGALVIHEQRVSRSIEWTRHLTSGAIAIGLVLGGYVWGTWSDWGLTSRLENFQFAVDRCAFAAPQLSIPGIGRVCRYDSLARTGDAAVRQ